MAGGRRLWCLESRAGETCRVVVGRRRCGQRGGEPDRQARQIAGTGETRGRVSPRSEEHTSELQSLRQIVCRLLLVKREQRKSSWILSSLEFLRTRRSDIRLSFFKYTATTEIYTLSLHDALPISTLWPLYTAACMVGGILQSESATGNERSEEHTSELQSLRHLVCRLLLEKK